MKVVVAATGRAIITPAVEDTTVVVEDSGWIMIISMIEEADIHR